MEGKQLIILAGGIIIVAIVVLAAAFFVLNNNGSPSATPTPAPGVTPAPTSAAGNPTAAAQGPTAKPDVPATPLPGGPIILQTVYNKSMPLMVTMFLNSGTDPIDVNTLKMDLESNGQAYHNVWAPKAADWTSSNGNSLLERNEALTAVIDTKALGIPQGSPVTVKILKDGAVVKEEVVTPY